VEERAQFTHDVDTTMVGAYSSKRARPSAVSTPDRLTILQQRPWNATIAWLQIQLRVEQAGAAVGAINWFALHGTSMNNTNRLVSGDNKGAASRLFEDEHRAQVGEMMGPYYKLQGWWEAVVLPAWDGSKTALAGSKSGFGPEKIWRFTLERPFTGLYCSFCLSETGTGRAPAGTTKSFPTALL
jgi:hypothetical protein